jgi:26S proteasome regulatory subunit N2
MIKLPLCFAIQCTYADSRREAMAEPLSGEIPSDYRPYAALLTSKTYFYIGIMNEAVEFALKAGKAFENEPTGEYKETIIGNSTPRGRKTPLG